MSGHHPPQAPLDDHWRTDAGPDPILAGCDPKRSRGVRVAVDPRLTASLEDHRADVLPAKPPTAARGNVTPSPARSGHDCHRTVRLVAAQMCIFDGTQSPDFLG